MTNGLPGMFRYLSISVAITLFILVIQPFGVAFTNTIEFLIILGLTPLNFLVMTFIHKFEFSALNSVLRSLLVILIITIANSTYLILLSGETMEIRTTGKVAIIVVLGFAAISLWIRERVLNSEVIVLRSRERKQTQKIFSVSSDNDRDVLRVKQDELLFVKSDKNYVQVFLWSDGVMQEKLLRTSLNRLLDSPVGTVLFRCHRSYAVNVSSAEQITRHGGQMWIVYPGGNKAPVSRAHRDSILKLAQI